MKGLDKLMSISELIFKSINGTIRLMFYNAVESGNCSFFYLLIFILDFCFQTHYQGVNIANIFGTISVNVKLQSFHGTNMSMLKHFIYCLKKVVTNVLTISEGIKKNQSNMF